MSIAPSRAAASPEIGWYASIAEWLAGLFLVPLSIDAAASYRDGLGASLFDALAEAPGCGSGIRRMRSAVMTPDSPVAVAHRLGFAFTRLFDGVGGPETVAPYESAHVGASGRLFQAPAGDMDLLLQQADLSAVETVREPPDHLSIELALLAGLLRRGDSHRALIALLDVHLLTWVPRFAERCRDADHTGFYAGAAAVLTGFLATLRAALGGHDDMTELPRRAADVPATPTINSGFG